MNKVEKIFYDLVKSTPWLKFIIRNCYQTFFDLLPRRKEHSINNILFKENYFYGFHDKTPFSSDENKILSNHLVLNELRMPKPEDKLEIGYFEFKNGVIGDYIKIGESLAWNYHKGCRLQWLDKNRFIFNTALNSKLISKIIDTDTLEEKIIDYPIDTVSENGEWATSFSYERLQKLMPGYGYPYNDSGYLNKNHPSETGLFIIDLKNNSSRLLLSLEDLVSGIKDKSQITNFNHYVTHSEFSLDGKYVSFLHRWTANDIRDRKTRLVIYNLDTKSYNILPTGGMVSHYVWNKNNQIIAYCNIENTDCHVLFDINEKGVYKKIVPNLLNSDGHQSFVSNTEFITDTYPDKFRMAKLFKVNIEKMEVNLLASKYSPKKYQTKNFNNHIACDLHPRVSPSGRYLSFDSIMNNNRSFCVMKLDNC